MEEVAEKVISMEMYGCMYKAMGFPQSVAHEILDVSDGRNDISLFLLSLLLCHRRWVHLAGNGLQLHINKGSTQAVKDMILPERVHHTFLKAIKQHCTACVFMHSLLCIVRVQGDLKADRPSPCPVQP